MDKNVADITLTKLSNLKFEFEDLRLQNQSTKISSMIFALTKYEIGQNLPREVILNALEKSIQIPEMITQNLWSIEGINGLSSALELLSPEEVILGFIAMLSEINLVFVSESMTALSSTMQAIQ